MPDVFKCHSGAPKRIYKIGDPGPLEFRMNGEVFPYEQTYLSRWVEIIVGDPASTEQTVVGVIVFDKDGNYFGHRIGSLDRARHRGDLTMDWTREEVDEWAVGFDTIAKVERNHTSIGSAMSWNRIGLISGALMTPQTLVDDLVKRLTCFKEWPPKDPLLNTDLGPYVSQVQQMLRKRHPDPACHTIVSTRDFEIDL